MAEKTSSLYVTCHSCTRTWAVALLPMERSRAIAALQNATCPSCGVNGENVWMASEIEAHAAASAHRGLPLTSRIARGCVVVDGGTARLSVLGKHAPMTANMLAVMRALLIAAPRILSRDQIIDMAWNGADIIDRDVDSTIKRIRQAIRKAAGKDGLAAVGIKTIYGLGYCCEPRAEVKRDAA